MLRQILRKFRKRGVRNYDDINPEDIFLDSANLPGFSGGRLEGRMEKPMGQRTFLALKIALICLTILLGYKLWDLGIKNGKLYADISENNRLSHAVIFANRGVIYDRNGLELATNDIKGEGSDFAGRHYSEEYKGLSHIVGYVKYPLADKSGFYYEENYRGRDGVEYAFNDMLSGTNGIRLTETNALGEVTSESVVRPPADGRALNLSIDARINDVLYKSFEKAITERGFEGGAGVILDVETGEVLSMVSAPEYGQNLITSGGNAGAVRALLSDSSKPFLNRVISGLYSPGSIIKPIVALGALNEKIISPDKKILSTGSITIPNPYNPEAPSIFRDWKAHGWTDMREALAVSSDVYFYSIGGGFGDQKGLGIERIDKYLNMFGLTEKTGIDLIGELSGNIPTPEWKKITFDGDIWRLGDTYITSIGQYGTLVTPIESARFVAAIANGGKLITPTVLKSDEGKERRQDEREVRFADSDWRIVQEGMRGAVTFGTASALNVDYVEVAAKTGTAETGAAKKYVHSWSVGYFPADKPRYAFAILLEKGPSTNQVGASWTMREVLDWMLYNAPEYLD